MLPQRGAWARAVGDFAADRGQLEAAEVAAEATRLGGTPVCDLPTRCRATICGTLRTVTLRPRGGVPALEAELFDGSGTVSLVWLGRRRIAGVEPGRRMRIQGVVSNDGNGRVVYNPRYELVPGSQA